MRGGLCDFHTHSMSLFFFSSRRRHTRSKRDWSSDVCSSDLISYSATQLTAASHGEPTFAQLGPGYAYDGLAFDNSGNLWAATEMADVAMYSQIGRASCRERVENAMVGGEVKQNSEERGSAGV